MVRVKLHKWQVPNLPLVPAALRHSHQSFRHLPDARRMATQEVLENQDLLKLIVCPASRTVGCSCLREWILQEIRGSKTLRGVNKLFSRVATGALNALMEYFQNRMSDFDYVTNIMYAADFEAYFRDNFARMFLFTSWPEAVFNLDIRVAKGVRSDLYFMLDQYKRRRNPETYDELAHLVGQKCACCGTTCALIAKDREKIAVYKPWIEHRHSFAAYAMHPYLGKLNPCQNFNVLQGTLIPYTHQDHFFEVAFVHEFETGEYVMRLHVYATMTTEERRFASFLCAARNKAWYRRNVERVFGLRSDALFCEEHNNRRKVFLATVCMFDPYFSNAKDWSVQSIFELTRAEVTATIRRGSAMVREEWLLT